MSEAPPFHHGPRPLQAQVHARFSDNPRFIRFLATVEAVASTVARAMSAFCVSLKLFQHLFLLGQRK